MKSFIHSDRPLNTVMVLARTPERAIELVKRGLDGGADAFGLSVCKLQPEYQSPRTVERIIREMGDKPVYITNYRQNFCTGKSDEQLSRELLSLIDVGATLLDLMGDYFDPTVGELTESPAAIEQQRRLIEEIHARGGEVLMSSHICHFTPAERVLGVARTHIARGADIAKIVTAADTMAEQMENLRITTLLKEELGAPFLYLSGGKCAIHRRIGTRLGCLMALCVAEHDELSTAAQPTLAEMKAIHQAFARCQD